MGCMRPRNVYVRERVPGHDRDLGQSPGHARSCDDLQPWVAPSLLKPLVTFWSENAADSTVTVQIPADQAPTKTRATCAHEHAEAVQEWWPMMMLLLVNVVEV